MICQAEPSVAEDECRSLAANGLLEGDMGLIVAIGAGASIRDAAERAGVSERTARRRWADPEFRREVSEFRRLAMEQAVSILACNTAKAALTLAKLLDEGGDAVNLGAARSILDYAERMRVATELENRLFEVEDRLDAHNAKSRSQNCGA